MPPEIRILSVRQPFAHLIVSGTKKVENRGRPLCYRGPLLIHAGKQWYGSPVEEIERRYGVTIPRDLPRGGIVGIVGMTDCVTKSDDRFFTGPFGWVMHGATPLPFIPCRGQIAVVKPDREVLAKLRVLPEWEVALGNTLRG